MSRAWFSASVRRLDWILLGSAAALSLVGLLLIYSASHHSAALSHLVWKQAAWLGLGALAMAFFAVIDYQSLIHASYFYFGGMLLLLMGLALFGRSSAGGAARWYNLGLFYFQPSEPAKLVLVLALTRYLADEGLSVRRFPYLLPPLLMTAAFAWLIMRQPDLGTALILVPISLVMLYVAGARPWHLAALLLSAALTAPLAWRFLRPYQKRRILAFFSPETDTLGAGYNAIQSGIAIGSGGLTGQGFLQGTQSQLNFVPMHHTDFIFSVLAEEWGFLGCLMVLLLYLTLLLQAVKIAVQARDLRGTLVAAGVASMLAAQVGLNVGMASGLLPVTGVTLPLLSYGGSSVLTTLAGLGVLINIRREAVGF